MSSSLDQLKAAGTTVVCDTGDFEKIAQYKPQDATTNPSLILAAATNPEYGKLVDEAVAHGKAKLGSGEMKNDEVLIDYTMDYLLALFGKAILAIIPGKVSTEVNAALSFDRDATVERAKRIIDIYKSMGIGKDRVLIKIASTWEGIHAAKILQEKYAINCNLTLMFSQVQAVAASEAKVYLVSPFVGRILDWFKAKEHREYTSEEDPGVARVKSIFNYYKSHGAKTIVMGASFRSVGEIKELAGCDYLTISPTLLTQLKESKDPVPQKLNVEAASKLKVPAQAYLDHESKFRFDLNEDAMASEKLREGISKFHADTLTLKSILRSKFARS